MKEKIRVELFKMQDLDYQKFHSRLCPGINNIIGVRVPNIKMIVKKILEDNYEEYLSEVDNKYYEETMIEGLIITTSKMSITKKIKYLDNYIPKINNWAICDTVCSSFKLKEEELSVIWNYLLLYQHSTKEFELRFMIVMMIEHFMLDDYISEIFKIIDAVKVDYYYTNMAIGWLISIAFIKYRKQTLDYLNNNNLSLFTYQKALQKIIESNKVNNQDKNMIQKMKKQ